MKDFNKDEADRLVDFFRHKRVTNSAEISRYIRTHNMREEWPNITGHITMESNDGREQWDYDGGISPAYFAYICRALELGGNGSGSHVASFRPYASRRRRA